MPNHRETPDFLRDCNHQIAAKFLLMIMLCIISNSSFCQETINNGIKWAKGLNWQQIREKAKMENKYIFVDCYATWCAPCKKMDEQTFSKKDIGEFFKDKFIAIKAQMDSTIKDPEAVRAWYKDAELLKKRYSVVSFPTLLFFNPQGELVEKVTGFQAENGFKSIAQASLKPDKKYEDPYKKFHVLLDKYQKGKKDFQNFPYMISAAKKIGENKLGQDLSKELRQHLLTLNKKELLNRAYVEFISENENLSNQNPGNILSRIFLTDAKKIDDLMERKNYSMGALNNMIRQGYVTDFLNGVTGKGTNANASVPWDKLYNDIATQFTKEIAEQNVLWAKIWYFDDYRDPRSLMHFIDFTKKYGTEALSQDPGTRDFYINHIGWIYCGTLNSDPNDVRYISELMKKAIDQTSERNKIAHRCLPWQYIDTYALLLHKIGEKEKAIRNQMDAINIYLNCDGGKKGDQLHQEMLKQLSKMQNGEVNFSGIWKLNLEKTQFNNTPGTPAATRVFVEHIGDSITFQRNNNPKESLKIDSTAFIEISDVDSKTKVSIKPTPDKQGLIETRIYTYPEGITSVVATKKIRTWALSPDKKILTIQDHIETTEKDRDYDMLLIYDRQ